MLISKETEAIVGTSTKSKHVCVICGESKSSFAFSLWPTTNKCTHKQATCRPCLKASIAFDIENKGVHRISCPQCSVELGYNDIVRYVDEPVRLRYETLLVRAALQDDENFIWVSAY